MWPTNIMGCAMRCDARMQWVAIALFFIGSLVGGFWLHQPRLVVIDMNRAIQIPASALSHSKLAPLRQQKIMQRFSSLLPDVIKTYGQSHHVTVVSATVFVSERSSIDITQDVVKQTLARLKHAS